MTAETHYAAYVAKMRTARVWGGHLELMAAANALARPVHVFRDDAAALQTAAEPQVAIVPDEGRIAAAAMAAAAATASAKAGGGGGMPSPGAAAASGASGDAAASSGAPVADAAGASAEPPLGDNQLEPLRLSYHGHAHYNSVATDGARAEAMLALGAAPPPVRRARFVRFVRFVCMYRSVMHHNVM